MNTIIAGKQKQQKKMACYLKRMKRSTTAQDIQRTVRVLLDNLEGSSSINKFLCTNT